MAGTANVPGYEVTWVAIKPKCREQRGRYSAFEEAVARLRYEYQGSLEDEEDSTFHLVMTVERPRI